VAVILGLLDPPEGAGFFRAFRDTVLVVLVFGVLFIAAGALAHTVLQLFALGWDLATW
jgi:hypothetical protein